MSHTLPVAAASAPSIVRYVGPLGDTLAVTYRPGDTEVLVDFSNYGPQGGVWESVESARETVAAVLAQGWKRQD